MVENDIFILDLLARLRGMQSIANSGILRAPSKTEISTPVRKPGYYSFFCIHDKHKWSTCRQCRRSSKDGARAREAYREMLAAKLSQ